MAKLLAGDEVGTVRMEPARAQTVASVLGQLMVGMSDLLVMVHSALGAPPDLDRLADPSLGLAVTDLILDEEGAESLESLLRGDIEILVNEVLPGAIDILGRISHETPESLREKWQEKSGLGKQEAE